MKGRAITYSATEMAWLEANRLMVISDYHRAFSERFRTDVSAQNLHSLRKRKGWKVGRGGGRLAGRLRRYTRAQIDWLAENVAMETSAWHRAFCDKFERRDVTEANLIGLRKRFGMKTGRTGRYAPGQAPANKGKKAAPGTGGRHPNARATQFKKGQLPHNTKHLGHERMTVDGYVEISVAETNPHTGYERRYVHKHVHLWVAANGPVPEGQVLKCLDGDKTNTDPSNWTPIARGVLARLNGGRFKRRPGYDQAEPEIRPALMAMAKIEHQVGTRKQQRAEGEAA